MEPCLPEYVRSSWTFRFLCLALPVFINLQTGKGPHGKLNCIDYPQLIFVISVSLLLSRLFEKHVRFYEDKTNNREAFKFEALLIGFAKILAHVVLSDLSLRLIWFPLQWFILWIHRKNILTTLVKLLLYVVKDFSTFRPFYLELVAVSSSPKGLIFLRFFAALLILNSVEKLFGLQLEPTNSCNSWSHTALVEPPVEEELTRFEDSTKIKNLPPSA